MHLRTPGATLRRTLLNTHAAPALGKRKAQAITRAEIAQVHSGLAETPYQANWPLAEIGGLYNFAGKHDLVAQKPCTKD